MTVNVTVRTTAYHEVNITHENQKADLSWEVSNIQHVPKGQEVTVAVWSDKRITIEEIR